MLVSPFAFPELPPPTPCDSPASNGPTLCEVRVDVALPRDDSPAAWERSWRKAVAKGRLTNLASGDAHAVSARARVCLPPGLPADALGLFLPTRLSALPGHPCVQMETPVFEGNWRGVRVWLSFDSTALPLLLRRAPKPFNPFAKGRLL